AFAPKSDWLASGGEDRKICLWTISDGTLRQQFSTQFPVESLAIAPDGTALLAAGGSNNARLIILPDGAARDLPPQKALVITAAFSSDGCWIASAGYEGVVQLWDRERDEVFMMSGGAPIRTLAFSPMGDWLATAGSDRVIRLWNFRSRQRIRDLSGHMDAVN